MKITSVTVTLKQTHSLPGYANVAPQVAYTAELEDDEDVAGVVEELRAWARLDVQEEIDQAREDLLIPAFYSRDARYDVRTLRRGPLVYVLPHACPLGSLEPLLRNASLYLHGDSITTTGHRHRVALRIAEQVAADGGSRSDREVVDWSRLREPLDTVFWQDMAARGMWAVVRVRRTQYVEGWGSANSVNYLVGPAVVFERRPDLWPELRFEQPEELDEAALEVSENGRVYEVADFDEVYTALVAIEAEFVALCKRLTEAVAGAPDTQGVEEDWYDEDEEAA